MVAAACLYSPLKSLLVSMTKWVRGDAIKKKIIDIDFGDTQRGVGA
jgi:hypothetical protein